MAIVHSLTKYKDVYTLFNEGVTSFSYILYIKDCTERLEISSGNLAADSSINLSTTKDGFYIVKLTENTEILEVPFNSFKNLLLSIVKSLKKVLCNCTCKNCDCDSSDKPCVLSQINAFILLNPEYTNTLNLIAPYFNCRLVNLVDCQQTNLLVYGKTSCKELDENLLILYYLTIYLYDSAQAVDAEEVSYVKSKLNYTVLQKCITMLGINISEIVDLLP